MAKQRKEELKPATMEVSGDAKSAPPPGAESGGDAAHHVVHLESERASRLRKRPTRY